MERIKGRWVRLNLNRSMVGMVAATAVVMVEEWW